MAHTFETYVYVMKPVGADGPIKIGSSRSPHQRLASYTRWSPIPLELVATVLGSAITERRIHHLLQEHHSHHEWFHGAPAVLAFVESIKDGTFDESRLPRPRALFTGFRMPEASVEASKLRRRLSKLKRAGIEIPPSVLAATNWHGASPDEHARRRAIVREFVASVEQAA